MNPIGFEEMNRRIRSFFDGLAADWEGTVCPQHADRLAGLIARLDMEMTGRILDVGTGTGVLIPLLATPGRVVVAVDLAFEMVRRAAGRPEGAACAQADVMRLPFAGGAFDWILCNSVFPHFLDQGVCVRELVRALRAGGRLVVCHTQSREAINAFHRSKGGLIGGHELPERAEMERMMGEVGLRTITHENAADHYLLVAERQK